jgi:hypothetical protein
MTKRATSDNFTPALIAANSVAPITPAEEQDMNTA